MLDIQERYIFIRVDVLLFVINFDISQEFQIVNMWFLVFNEFKNINDVKFDCLIWFYG